MSARELAEWSLFEEGFGPLTLHERLDALAAQICYIIHASAGGKGRLEDFIPQWRRAPKMEITDWLSALATKERP
jgi:hypothetical protein